jgi:excinuclease ABC subunit C
MVITEKLHKKILAAPSNSGIYIWKDAQGKVLYIGKAINLKRRLLSYTKSAQELDKKTSLFLRLSESLSWIKVRNDLEAILLEMNLIRALKPKYNFQSKDDKRPLFVHITKDYLPRVTTSRTEIAGNGQYFGPFPSGYNLRRIMSKVRHIFPYCSCSIKRKKKCLFPELGLCNPCAVELRQVDGQSELKRKYRRQIKRLAVFLGGDIEKVIKLLERDMNEYSAELKYEKASEVKLQIEGIKELLAQKSSIAEYLTRVAISPYLAKSQQKSLAQFLGLPFIRRIEGYDVANTSGTNATAAMVVFEGGQPNTSEYRKFKVSGFSGPNDPGMMRQVLLRRFKHYDWEEPDLIMVDGGKTQVSAALKAMKTANRAIRVVGLAKRLEQIVIPNEKGYRIVTPPLDAPYLTLLRAVRDEAHRFGTRYHKKLRSKKMLE